MLFALLLAVVAFPAGSLLRAQTEIQVVPSPAADPKVYGEYPIAYKEIITRWMESRLVDPASAVFEWIGEPRPGEVSPKKGQKVVGYIVDFKVNARNQFGAPTGKQRYQVVIRNGEVIWGGRPRS
jgi:hypothetical protein